MAHWIWLPHRLYIGRTTITAGRAMGIRGLLLCIAVLTCGVTSASATMRIVEDHGGQIGKYLQTFALVRSTGERVVVDGDCLSACTLVLGLIPHNQICATPRARFGFHSAWMPDIDGRPITSVGGTQALWNFYPVPVRRWINQHGGLSRRMIYMEGRSLNGIVATCDRPTQAHAASAGTAGYSGDALLRWILFGDDSEASSRRSGN